MLTLTSGPARTVPVMHVQESSAFFRKGFLISGNFIVTSIPGCVNEHLSCRCKWIIVDPPERFNDQMPGTIFCAHDLRDRVFYARLAAKIDACLLARFKMPIIDNDIRALR